MTQLNDQLQQGGAPAAPPAQDLVIIKSPATIVEQGLSGLQNTISMLIPGTTFTSVSVELPPYFSERDWFDAVTFTVEYVKANTVEGWQLQWALADLLRHGERVLGERAAQAVALSTSVQGVYNVVWMAGIPPKNRTLKIPFWSHAPLVPLPPEEQRYWLDRAIKEEWSRTTLKEKIDAAVWQKQGLDPIVEKVKQEISAVLAAADDVNGGALAVIEAEIEENYKNRTDPVNYDRDRAQRKLEQAAAALLDLGMEEWRSVLMVSFFNVLRAGLGDLVYDEFSDWLQAELAAEPGTDSFLDAA